jgi:hypothetical protein
VREDPLYAGVFFWIFCVSFCAVPASLACDEIMGAPDGVVCGGAKSVALCRGLVSRQLRSKNPDMIGSLQQQAAGNHTLYSGHGCTPPG